MTRPVLLAVLAASAFAAVPVTLITPAQAQVEVQIGTTSPRYGAWGDRDRDGIPNAYDRHDNRRAWNNRPWGDRDRDGVPNAYDRFDNRGLRDKDHDGVPQAWDRNDRNPWRQ